MPDYRESIRMLSGIGPKKAELFAKLGVTTIADLLRLYPRTYEDRTKIVSIASLEVDTPACFVASIIRDPQTHRIPKQGQRTLELTKVSVADHTGRLNLTFFNSAYTAQKLRRGETYCFYGSVTGDHLGFAMINPLFEPLDAPGKVTRCIVPVYPLTAGLTNKVVLQAVRQALLQYPQEETLSPEIRQRYRLCGRMEALRQIHEPTDAIGLEQARRRLAFEEYFRYSAALSMLRAQRQRHTTEPLDTSIAEDFFTALPFSLTAAQSRVIAEIFADFRSGIPMSRLIQGDVGSGKTMIAAAAAYCVAKNGRQTALLAPTEILAHQHFERLSPLFSKLGVTCTLLTGSMTGHQKALNRAEIAEGNTAVVIGTHALLTETTSFARLGLVIADEQQRFGVTQRAALQGKGDLPHLLLLSATPIPRTLALILYGDLEVSIVDELPPGRQPVESFLVDERYRKRLNGFIRKQAQEGHQTFIVCPAIEEGESESLKAAEVWAQTLAGQVFPTLRVALLHGRMKGAEKEAVMRAFANGEYDILVATTVIEVGVDVPNATLMVIENADRFGLSQLHQLRGRIGRGAEKSYCILVSDNQNAETRARLKALCATADGFRIAEEDLKLRGPGDFFGSRQSGLPMIRAGMLNTDVELVRQAREAAAEAIASEEPLERSLAEEIQTFLERGATLN